MKKNRIAIIGMSPGNSYFSRETIEWLVAHVQWKFDIVRVMIPDYPAKYTYQALWARNPESKARLKGNAIRNNVNRILWIEENICIDWKNDINTHPAYKKALKEILNLSKANEEFRNALEQTTKEVLASKTDLNKEKIRIWIKFLICELAFLISAREILGQEVTYIYHRSWTIFTDLISWRFDGIQRPIDFEIITKDS